MTEYHPHRRPVVSSKHLGVAGHAVYCSSTNWGLRTIVELV